MIINTTNYIDPQKPTTYHATIFPNNSSYLEILHTTNSQQKKLLFTFI